VRHSTLIVVGVIALIACARPSSAACPVGVTPVTVTFLNGMFVLNEGKAKKAAEKLTDAIAGDPRWALVEQECVEFKYAYNHADFVGFGDIGDVIIQFYTSTLSSALSWLAELEPPDSGFSNALIEIADLVDVSGCVVTGFDCFRIANAFRANAKQGKMSLVVAHSQGNYFGTTIHSDVVESGEIDSALFQLVGVGTPDPDSDDVGPYVNLAFDPITAFSGLPPTANNQDGCLLLWCHWFVGSYLEGKLSRIQLLDYIFSYLPKRDTIEWLDFLEGSPNRPGDGKTIASIGGRFKLAEPVSLASAFIGFHARVFFTPPVDVASNIAPFLLGIANATSLPQCELTVFSAGSIKATDIINGAEGAVVDYPPNLVQGIVDFFNYLKESSCPVVSLEDLRIVTIDQNDGVDRLLDAASIGLGPSVPPPQ
jgi:hypothetical protein